MGMTLSGVAVNRGAAGRSSLVRRRLRSTATATGDKGWGCTTVKAGLIHLDSVLIVSRR